MRIRPPFQTIILALGICLFVAGGLIAWFAFSRYDALPDYLKLAAVIPLLVSYPMLSVRAYANWNKLSPHYKAHIAMAVAAPILVGFGVLMWVPLGVAA